MMSQENVRLSVAFGLAILLASFYAPSLRGQIAPPPLSQAGPAEETDIYIVTFRPGTPGSQRAAAAQGAGAVLRFNFNVVNAISVRVPNAAVLTRLQNDPRVVAVFANLSISLHASQVQVQAKGGKAGGGGGKGGGGGGSGGGGGGGVKKPAAPRKLSATAVSSSEINLTWQDKSDNEESFEIERCTGSGCAGFVPLAQVGANVTSYSDLGLGPETSCSYRVRAVNSGGNSSYSNIDGATTDPGSSPSPPAVPTILDATAVSYRQIDLVLGDNSDNEDGFRIERCTGSGCGDVDFLQVAQVGANVTSYSDLGLTAETSYNFRVRAFSNAGGDSPYSNIAEATTLANPAGSQVVPSGVGRIDAPLSWAASWTGQGVGVAIADTGLDFNHLDLDLNPEVEGVNSFNAFGGSCQDDYGHGTHVGGIVAARDNTIDVVGVAPDATLYCVKVFTLDPILGPIATDESLIAGLNWIATNANQVSPPIRVVNMSLGRSKTPEDNPNHPLHLAVKALYDSGISVVVSAGNDQFVEVSQQVPASYEEVMAIASTTALDGVNGYDDFFTPCLSEPGIKADTASYFTTDGAFVGGIGVTVSAPGEQQEDIYDYFGTCFLEPVGILSTAMGGGTTQFYGTSMSAPHVAGVVALMWEKELSFGGLSLDPEDARTRIRSGVVRPGTAPLDSPTLEYSFDLEREGVLWAPGALGDLTPPPPDLAPTVSIAIPGNGSIFDPPAPIDFQGSATDPEDFDLTASLVWTSSKDGQIGTGGSFQTTLSNGIHTITASVTDSGGNTANDSISITVGSPGQPSTVAASSITYGMQLPQLTTLLITVEVVNDFLDPVSGAAVSAIVTEWLYTGALYWFDGTTNAEGKVVFEIPNAPYGCYTTQITNVVADGLTWVPGDPDNYFCF